jgi:hypothetical protein
LLRRRALPAAGLTASTKLDSMVRRSSALLIDERLDGDGEPLRTWLHVAAGAEAIALTFGGETVPLPARALVVAMRRYGRELEPGVEPGGERHEVAGSGTIERMRFRAGVDADGRDYLVWREPDRPPLAALSKQIAAALRFFAAGG